MLVYMVKVVYYQAHVCIELEEIQMSSATPCLRYLEMTWTTTRAAFELVDQPEALCVCVTDFCNCGHWGTIHPQNSYLVNLK